MPEQKPKAKNTLPGINPMPSHVQQTYDLMQAMQKAATIGPSRVGERYVPTEAQPDILDLLKRYVMGGEGRPTSVATHDPYGIEAWQKGAGPMPMMAGTTQELGGLYSRLERAFEALPEGATFHPSKALSIAKNAAAKEEIEWRKLPEFLTSKGNTHVSKADILQHLRDNPIQLKETVLGEPAFHDPRYTAGGPPGIPTKYNEYTLPGGQNYRENLTQLVTPRDKINKQIDKLADDQLIYNDPGRGVEGLRQFAEANRQINELTLQREALPLPYQSSHFDQPNILGHTRTKERTLPTGFPENSLKAGIDPEKINDLRRTQAYLQNEGPRTPETLNKIKSIQDEINSYFEPVGKKGTFIEEVQSDWHQQGKEYRYTNPSVQADARNQIIELEKQREALYQQREKIVGEQWRIQREWQRANPSNKTPGYVLEPEYRRLEDQYEQRGRQVAQIQEQLARIRGSQRNAVPDAPFKESWPDLLLKKELLKAAKDPEKSWLGWTTGKTQNDRYNLAKQFGAIYYTPQTGHLEFTDGEGRLVEIPNMPDTIYPEALHQYIGQDLAKEVLERPTSTETYTPPGAEPEITHHLFLDQNREIGGAGMKYFYDQLLPSRMNRILKPFGGKVELGEIPTGNPGVVSIPGGYAAGPETFQAWIAKLTPEMKQRIAKEGLPLLAALYAFYQNQKDQKTPIQLK